MKKACKQLTSKILGLLRLAVLPVALTGCSDTFWEGFEKGIRESFEKGSYGLLQINGPGTTNTLDGSVEFALDKVGGVNLNLLSSRVSGTIETYFDGEKQSQNVEGFIGVSGLGSVGCGAVPSCSYAFRFRTTLNSTENAYAIEDKWFFGSDGKAFRREDSEGTACSIVRYEVMPLKAKIGAFGDGEIWRCDDGQYDKASMWSLEQAESGLARLHYTVQFVDSGGNDGNSTVSFFITKDGSIVSFEGDMRGRVDSSPMRFQFSSRGPVNFESGVDAKSRRNAFESAGVRSDLLTPHAQNGGAEPAEPRSGRDVIDIAVGAGQFTTFVAAVQAAGLVETLDGPGPFTVFAPTEAAFAALPHGTVEDLLRPENKAILASILTYHVTASKVPSSAVAGKTVDLATLQGETVKVVGAADGTVTVNDAKVVTADVNASNGVIHVIDKVLLPPSL
jgi:uncharacterized surface protein with fasciclin (FAS1) repeats